MLDRITQSIERYMDLLSTRQKVVASNIANADTPGYKTKDLDFQSQFRAEMNSQTASFIYNDAAPTESDGNNVSIDREARMLAENALRFNLASNLMRSQLRMVKEAIQEGKS